MTAMAKVTKLEAREISDSRGNPTLEVELELNNQFAGQATVPAGASTGKHEAIALPVNQAIANIVGEMAQKLIDHDFDQESLDAELIALDGTLNKNHLGANATLGVSFAFAQAWAQSQGKELFETIAREIGSRAFDTTFPFPMFNILNGGRHAKNSTDIQEFMIVPIGATSFREALTWGQEIYQALGKILETKNLSLDLGDEGGFAPTLSRNTEALDLLVEAIKQAGYKPGQQISLALDVATSELKVNDNYVFPKGLTDGSTTSQTLTGTELIKSYEELVSKYPIISIEDGLGEDDWAGWQELTARLGNKINLVGDDLFVTNLARLHKGIDKKVANAIIIKPNQIGTLTETLAVIKLAQSVGYQIIVSHRSGETLDTVIADLAVATSANFIKAGAPSRPERLVKYNRLLDIETKLSISTTL